MVNLFTSFYEEKDKGRREELDYCLKKNVENKAIDVIYLIVEGNAQVSIQSNKIQKISVNERPRFSDFFETVNLCSQKDDTNIITNSDIYFGERDAYLIHNHIQPNKCFALTRYDVQLDGKIVFLNRRDSQDSWCFKGHIPYKNMYCDFFMGRPGCDNRLAAEFDKIKYNITNPSKSIFSYHLHNTQVKSYVRTPEFIVPEPYMRLDPVAL